MFLVIAKGVHSHLTAPRHATRTYTRTEGASPKSMCRSWVCPGSESPDRESLAQVQVLCSALADIKHQTRVR